MAEDSLIYADDTTVTVKIPAVLPDPANNPITVTTKYGSATYNFRILQPPPTILSFDPMAGPEGQLVTITGYNFGGVNSVKFGTNEATIVSNTKEEIKVNVPAGVTAEYIFVTTPSGTVRSAKLYGFRYEVFTDALTTGWSFSLSSANVGYNAAIADTVKRGSRSVRIDFRGSFSFLRFVKTAAMSTTGFQGVKFSMYAPANFMDKKVRVYLNNSSTPGSYTINVSKVNQWVEYEIPLINFGNPATLTHIIFNEFSGTAGLPRQFYVDDLGLY
ncbi:MAG: IPT/TIG domain-containing protein [Chitinophagaceae bacterium]|nr:IPT/TIG domain-containing protein [Chitinophagaceae bacterium]